MSKEIQLSASEEAALLALAARGTLRGDKRTDALAGTIHAPTAKRLCEKGFVGLSAAGYGLTAAGKARLPGADALQPTEPRDCKKYLGRTLKGQKAIICDKAEGHAGDCDNALLKPMDDEHGVVLEAAKALGAIEFVHVGDKLPKPPNGATPIGQKRVKASVESRASLTQKAAGLDSQIGQKSQDEVARFAKGATAPESSPGGLSERTRKRAQERADAAIGRKPKAPSEDAAPAILAEALCSGVTPAAPALLADALDPSAPKPSFVNVTPEINDLVEKLHATGTLLLKDAKGASFRINAQNHGSKGFEYWINNVETGFWSRVLLGSLPRALSGVTYVNNNPEPGVRPFRAPQGQFPVGVGVKLGALP